VMKEIIVAKVEIRAMTYSYQSAANKAKEKKKIAEKKKNR
jgi:hypothetical protein